MALYLEVRPDVSEKEQIYHLKEQLELYLNNLDTSSSGEVVTIKGDPGAPGRDGRDGASCYVYLRYSANSDGSNMTVSPQADTAYLGIQVTDEEGAGSLASDYVWFRILGAAGYSPSASVSKSGTTATITITDTNGTTTAQVLDGSPNTLTIGTVENGRNAAATITGTAPNQVLNLVLPRGADGQGAGDMLKADYDQDDDGVVDNSEQLEGHPASYFAPASSLTGYLPLTGGTLTGALTGTTTTMDDFYLELDDTATSGTDYEIIQLLTALGWTDVLV